MDKLVKKIGGWVKEVFEVIANVFRPKPRKIPKPKSPQETLHFWLLHAHKGRERHDTAARRYETSRLLLGGVATLLATLAGASVLSNLVVQTWDVRGRLLVGVIGVLAGFSAGLITFLNLSERVDKHRSAGVQYKIVIRELERMIGLSSSACTPTETELEKIEKQLNELEESAPVVSERIYARVDREWDKRGIKYVDNAGDFYLPKQKGDMPRQENCTPESEQAHDAST